MLDSVIIEMTRDNIFAERSIKPLVLFRLLLIKSSMFTSIIDISPR